VGGSGGGAGVDARGVLGRGVRSPPALALLDSSGWWSRHSCHRRLGRQLVKAGERLVLAVGVEVFDARQQAIGSEDPEREELPLIGATAGAGGAKVSPAHEERISLQAEDFVVARGDGVGDL